MSRFSGVRGTLAVLAVVAAAVVVGVPSAVADTGFHGIAFNKGCDSPTLIGQPYSCSYQILNLVDQLHDTLKINGLSDQVHSAGGDVNSGAILSSLQLVFSDPSVTCTGGSGAGTSASPYVGATSCLIPFNQNITTKPFSFYTAQANDFNLPGHSLTDTATLAWNDTCNVSDTTPLPRNCTTGAQSASAGSASEIDKLPSVTSTTIHNAAHGPVTVVEAGSTVHDFVTLTGTAGQPAPSGNVSFSFFGNNACTGSPLAGPSLQGPLVDQGGGVSTLDATGFPQGPLTAGFYGFKASYGGDGIYLPSDGACEPLQVVDANIQLTPATATNHVGTPHTLTCHINVNDGSGQVNAPDGTVCTVSIVSGPGTPASQNCTVSGGAGNCQVTINSAVTGTSTIQASTNVTVAGLVVHRQTGDAHLGDGPNAQKLWVNAAILITPNATNEINHPHTFTATLLFDTGSGLAPAGAGQTVTLTLTGSNGANPNPAGPFTLTTDANGQVQVTFTSATPGHVTGSASWTGSVNGSNTFSVSTDGTGANSGPATKTFVDANIQITPATAVNPVGTNHTLHCHINVNDGSGAGYVSAPAGTVCTVNITAGPGTPATQNCSTVGTTGTCDAVITSSTAGTSTIQATTTVSVGGVALTRTTGDANVGDGPNAQKQWVKAKIVIAPNATNEINHPHTFTATVSQDNGSGYQTVGAGVPVTVTLTGSNGANPNPAGPFSLSTDANGQVSVTFTSATPGKVNGHACATLTVAGQPLQVCTDGTGDNSGDAVKTFVDANISITPATANNPVGTNHTLHCHINVNDGGGAGYVSAPAGTVCTVNITAGPGTPATQNCSTVGTTGTCDAVITSSTTGTSTIQATTTVTVGGVALTRTTGDSNVGDGANASKNWADDTIVTHVRDAANNDITGTTVTAGTVVHDTATVAKAAGTPAGVPDPSGSVTFTLYDNGTCNGNVLATDPNEALSGGTATSVTFTTPSGTSAAFSYLAHYNGDANYPAHDAACEPFNTQGTPKGQIAPTQTTCSDFTSGTSQTLSAVNYSLSGGKIGQGINPGVFFFYSTITTTVPNQVVTVTETNNSLNNTPLFGILNGQAWLWTGDCASKIVGTTTGANGSGASFTVATPGTYVISLKYSTKTIAGANAPNPADITYTFTTSLGGQTGASVLLHKQ